MIRSKWMVGVLALTLVACESAEETDTAEIDVSGDSLAMEPAPMPEAGMDQPPGGMGQTAQLSELQGSGVGGEVTVADRGDQTEILVRLTGAPPNASHPGHVHAGTCDAIGSVVQPLEPIQTDSTGTGTMTTNLGVAPMTIMNGQHVVVYHGTGGRPITCAQIPAHQM